MCSNDASGKRRRNLIFYQLNPFLSMAGSHNIDRMDDVNERIAKKGTIRGKISTKRHNDVISQKQELSVGTFGTIFIKRNITIIKIQQWELKKCF